QPLGVRMRGRRYPATASEVELYVARNRAKCRSRLPGTRTRPGGILIGWALSTPPPTGPAGGCAQRDLADSCALEACWAAPPRAGGRSAGSHAFDQIAVHEH